MPLYGPGSCRGCRTSRRTPRSRNRGDDSPRRRPRTSSPGGNCRAAAGWPRRASGRQRGKAHHRYAAAFRRFTQASRREDAAIEHPANCYGDATLVACRKWLDVTCQRYGRGAAPRASRRGHHHHRQRPPRRGAHRGSPTAPPLAHQDRVAGAIAPRPSRSGRATPRRARRRHHRRPWANQMSGSLAAGVLDTSVFIAANRSTTRHVVDPRPVATTVITLAELTSACWPPLTPTSAPSGSPPLKPLPTWQRCRGRGGSTTWARSAFISRTLAKSPYQRPLDRSHRHVRALPVVTQDDDFDALDGAANVTIVWV